MRIVIDLDGTICPTKKDNQSYDELIPYRGAKEKLSNLKQMDITLLFKLLEIWPHKKVILVGL